MAGAVIGALAGGGKGAAIGAGAGAAVGTAGAAATGKKNVRPAGRNRPFFYNPVMRLFTAIDLPPELVRKLTELIDHLRPAARINWSPAANLHITTKFIGEWPEAELGRVTAALAGLPAREPIPIELRGVGFLPNPHSPRVFWAAVRAGEALPELARETARRSKPSESRPKRARSRRT